ncbi:MAG TPA: DUF4838 domain-containing protein [Candidatus Polarisedimenticolaceae bacterium]|nr:DUF4838 domain-containing protein [Candidatus Polarisedimenticolaceae bacterium]
MATPAPRRYHPRDGADGSIGRMRPGAGMTTPRVGATLLAALAAACPAPAAAGSIRLAADGQARAAIVVPPSATAAEREAAAELGHYLDRVTGGSFPVVADAESAPGLAAIRIGWTDDRPAGAPRPEELGPEEWVVRTDERGLAIYGGRPRGTLYGVYHFLEDEIGVEWWTPFDEFVPHRPTLIVEPLDERGAPAFGYRDIAVESGPPRFRARSRLNGHFSRLPLRLGGSLAFAPPSHAHTAFLLVPPELYDDHPELFAEIGGMRFAGDSQLCLSEPAVVDRVVDEVLRHLARARAAAERSGFAAPRLVSVSQNDWERPCECAGCMRTVAQRGSRAATWIVFVNEVARRVAEVEPDVLVETLAYQHTLAPPTGPPAASNVVVRVSGLHQRDLLRPITAADNRVHRAALLGWDGLVEHLFVWDYTVEFGEDGNLPLPNLALFADDLRFYRRVGVEGVYYQPEDPIADDLRDLKIWVLARLIADPSRSVEALVRRFTDGYYGTAGKSIRAYLAVVERAARRADEPLFYGAPASAHPYLDRRFFAHARRLFDRAERRVAERTDLAARVRSARLALDRATMALWSRACADACGADEFDHLARRYRATWSAELGRRAPTADLDAALAEVDREIAFRRRRADPPAAPAAAAAEPQPRPRNAN